MRLNELKQLIGNQKSLTIEVRSIDPSIYLIFCCRDDERAPLKAANGDNLIFRSRKRAFDALRDIGVKQADFVHKSAFDEMIGVGDSVPTEHRETIFLQDLIANA